MDGTGRIAHDDDNNYHYHENNDYGTTFLFFIHGDRSTIFHFLLLGSFYGLQEYCMYLRHVSIISTMFLSTKTNDT
ncbi:hypothetical protein L3i20_v211530 [Paenibacillus sp. L3-i20]|nr:hypothetical protein L3i20_v211530 [Paenibacillus sp. L3-i20]